MSAPIRKDELVDPLHLQPVVARSDGWRGRSGGLVAVALVGFVLVGVVLGRSFSDDGPPQSRALIVSSSAPSAAVHTTPGPTLTPLPMASPLPTMEILGGHLPTERRLVYANGLQVLDLATGTLEPTVQSLYDQMWPIGPDQLVCACLLGGIAGGDTAAPRSVRFGRFELTGALIAERDLLSFDGVVAVPDMTDGFNVVSTVSADESRLYVLTVARRPPVWSIDLYEVNVETGEIVAQTSLGRVPVDLGTPSSSPSPSPAVRGATPDGTYLWASALTAASDGRTVYASVQSMEYRSGVRAARNREWMVPVRGSHLGGAIRIKAAAGLKSDDWCVNSPTSVDSVVFVQVCAPGGALEPGETYYLRRLTTAGESLGDVPIAGMPVSQQYSSMAIVDVPARAMFIWDPGRHALARIGIDDGVVELSIVPDSMLAGASQPDGPSGVGASPALVMSPDGKRLYALGMLPDSFAPAGRSTGIWVFDARTLDLLDHWEPRALLNSLAVSADGRFVYAAGVPGFDAGGRETPWPASVTVYDATTGEIQVLHGAVSRDSFVTFPVWP